MINFTIECSTPSSEWSELQKAIRVLEMAGYRVKRIEGKKDEPVPTPLPY